MPKRVQFDRLIREGLWMKSGELPPPEGMGERVRGAVMSGERRKARWIRDYGWKKAVAAAACFTLVAVISLTAFSPAIQAAAAEKAGQIINKIEVVITSKKVEGGVLTTSEITFKDTASEKEAQEVIARNREKAGGLSSDGYCSNLEEAEAKAGFRIRVPTYLPEGFKLPYDRIMVSEYSKKVDGGLVKTGEHNVYMRFDSGEDEFQGMMLMISEIGMEFKPGFRYEAVKVGGRDARWYDSELIVQDQGKDAQARVERALSWEEGDLAYLLTDYSGLSREELIKIMESMK